MKKHNLVQCTLRWCVLPGHSPGLDPVFLTASWTTGMVHHSKFNLALPVVGQPQQGMDCSHNCKARFLQLLLCSTWKGSLWPQLQSQAYQALPVPSPTLCMSHLLPQDISAFTEVRDHHDALLAEGRGGDKAVSHSPRRHPVRRSNQLARK